MTRPRLRPGCFGALVFGLAVVLGLYALLAPWAFHMGGRWTPTVWWGYGKLRTAGGEQFPLFVYFFPRLGRGSRLRLDGKLPSSALRGMAWLCTAPGVSQRLTLSGEVYGAYLHTEGSLVAFRLLEPQKNFNTSTRRNYFDLYGEWRGQDLVMADRGIWAWSFHSGQRNEHVTVTLQWGSYRDFKALCGTQDK